MSHYDRPFISSRPRNPNPRLHFLGLPRRNRLRRPRLRRPRIRALVHTLVPVLVRTLVPRAVEAAFSQEGILFLLENHQLLNINNKVETKNINFLTIVILL